MKKIFIILLLVLAVGCSKKYTKAPAEGPDEQDTMQEAVTDVETEVIEDMTIARDEEVTETALSPEEEAASIFRDVFFDYDKYDIRADGRPALDAVADFLNRNAGLNVAIEGHCDERGTNEYNLALGERRAKAAKNYLVSLGVSSSRLIAITYGEEKPSCTESSEQCWQQNRRAHFIVVKGRL